MVLTALLVTVAANQTQLPKVPKSSAGAAGGGNYIPPLKPNSHLPGETVLGDWSGFTALMWRTAAREENLSVHNASYYARQAIKFPRSWVKTIYSLSHRKQRNYNFIGREGPRDVREWVMDFAKEHFGDEDYFEFTELKDSSDTMWKQRLGPFDKTGLKEDHFHKALASQHNDFQPDEFYYKMMASSKFTLCPRGDHPFAERFMDAIAAGSIPIIRSVEKDLDSPFWMMTSVPYHHYALDDGTPLEYRQDWVDENTRLFIKYNTFMEGDSVPEDWHPPPGMKEAIDIAER